MIETRPAYRNTTHRFGGSENFDWMQDLADRLSWLYEDPAQHWIDNLPDIEAWNRLGEKK
jgi:hypothetical protein